MMDSPSDDIQSLPEGLEALRALVLTTIAERDAAVTERDILLAQNDRLRHLLRQLQRMQFGPRSERLPEEQLQLGLEALEQAIAKEDAEAEKRDPDVALPLGRRIEPVGGRAAVWSEKSVPGISQICGRKRELPTACSNISTESGDAMSVMQASGPIAKFVTGRL